MGTYRTILDSSFTIPKAKLAAFSKEIVRRSTYFDYLSTAERTKLKPAEVWRLLADEEPQWPFVFDTAGNITGLGEAEEARAGWEVEILQAMAKFIDKGFVCFGVENTEYRAKFRGGECTFAIENEGEDYLAVVEDEDEDEDEDEEEDEGED